MDPKLAIEYANFQISNGFFDRAKRELELHRDDVAVCDLLKYIARTQISSVNRGFDNKENEYMEGEGDKIPKIINCGLRGKSEKSMADSEYPKIEVHSGFYKPSTHAFQATEIPKVSTVESPAQTESACTNLVAPIGLPRASKDTINVLSRPMGLRTRRKIIPRIGLGIFIIKPRATSSNDSRISKID